MLAIGVELCRLPENHFVNLKGHRGECLVKFANRKAAFRIQVHPSHHIEQLSFEWLVTDRNQESPHLSFIDDSLLVGETVENPFELVLWQVEKLGFVLLELEDEFDLLNQHGGQLTLDCRLEPLVGLQAAARPLSSARTQ